MSDNLKQDVFCILPFVQTVVRTDGAMSSCCNISGTQNIRNTDIAQFWNSSEVAELKQKVLGDQPVPQCELCYKQERVQGESMRIRSLQDYKFFSKPHRSKVFNYFGYAEKKFPKKIEWHIQNLCNLKCLTCNPRDSSAFLTENQQLKITNLNQSQYSIDNNIIEKNLQLILNHQVDMLDLRGGESMLIPKIQNMLLSLAPEQYDCTLSIQTNGTVLNSNWKTILSRFKKIKIMLSVDAYGSDNYYIRYPADWDKIESNTDYFLSQSNINVHINCTISNLNFPLLPKLVYWAKSKKLFINWSFVDIPEYFHFTNLPQPIFNAAKLQASKFSGLEHLITAQSNTQYWPEFCNMITLRDTHRKNSVFDILPDLQNFWIN
jgi:MoaA/NifB/PqqE/SkfB family radical SAM enzyme